MMQNRSVPTDSVLPHVMYQCIPDALTWLSRVFGFVEHYRYGEPRGPVSGAQVYAGNAVIQLSRARGFKIPSHETVYGERQYAVEDLEGHRWLFSQHARDLSPEDWGARVARRTGD